MGRIIFNWYMKNKYAEENMPTSSQTFESKGAKNYALVSKNLMELLHNSAGTSGQLTRKHGKQLANTILQIFETIGTDTTDNITSGFDQFSAGFKIAMLPVLNQIKEIPEETAQEEVPSEEVAEAEGQKLARFLWETTVEAPFKTRYSGIHAGLVGQINGRALQLINAISDNLDSNRGALEEEKNIMFNSGITKVLNYYNSIEKEYGSEEGFEEIKKNFGESLFRGVLANQHVWKANWDVTLTEENFERINALSKPLVGDTTKNWEKYRKKKESPNQYHELEN